MAGALVDSVGSLGTLASGPGRKSRTRLILLSPRKSPRSRPGSSSAVDRIDKPGDAPDDEGRDDDSGDRRGGRLVQRERGDQGNEEGNRNAPDCDFAPDQSPESLLRLLA